ncbi:hypothetical protein PESP_a3062 [Pseudoalteromonas espejiana DSM 9414]|nr:hypothetical protein PESP_a3062 [Pseudoalteromonas espejiana DSM 9414]
MICLKYKKIYFYIKNQQVTVHDTVTVICQTSYWHTTDGVKNKNKR